MAVHDGLTGIDGRRAGDRRRRAWRAAARARAAFAVVVAVAGVALASPAAAQVRRFALVIGQNQGDADDQLLRYAERDAERLADVLVGVGSVPRGDLVLLRDTSVAGVADAFADLDARIAAAPGETMLIVYYSGHADDEGLHLGGARLQFGDLKARLQRSAATVRVLIIDACRSGQATRVKGAKPAAPFTIRADDRLAGEGLAIITSAASGEDAQESDRLQGSFFTHHLVAGLIGAADRSRDARVTLHEAYQYAYTETLRATTLAPIVQHPTYSFQLRGKQEIVLTSFDAARTGMGRLRLEAPGVYVVFERGDDGAIVAETAVTDTTDIMLPVGRYFIRRRAGDAVYEGTAAIAAGQVRAVGTGDLRSVPSGQIVRKGLAPARSWSVAIGAAVGTRALPAAVTGGAYMWRPSLGVQLDHRLVSFDLRLSYGRRAIDGASDPDGKTDAAHEVMAADVGIMKFVDWRRAWFGGGARVGLDRVTERWGDVNTADGAREPGFLEQTYYYKRGSLLGRAGLQVTSWLGVYVEGAGNLYLLPDDGYNDDLAMLSTELTAGLLVHAL
jgi:hypothetical protein